MVQDRPIAATSYGLFRSGWFAVAVLVAAYAVSFLDRQVVGLLVEPLKKDLGISDTQIGILQGPAFGLFYAVLGLPLGWLADRVHRVRLVAIAIVLWSSATIACGLASSFAGLLLGRFGVGVGEAALVPAAVSLLADLFRPERRAVPLSVFTSGVSVGAGLALILGSAFTAYAHDGASDLPLLGAWLATRQTWQTVFILSGLVGLPVAAIVLAIGEPLRQAHGPNADARSAAAVVKHLVLHRGLFGPLLAGTGALYVVSNAVAAWLPSLFVRRFDWTPPDVGQTLGPFIMVFALSGNIASGLLTAWMGRRGVVNAPARTMLIGACLILPAATIGPLAPTAGLAMAGIFTLYFAIARTFGIATTAFVAVTPPALRGQVVALYLLIGNLLGFGLGPIGVGALLDYGPEILRQIGPAMSFANAVVAIPAIFLLRKAHAAFARAAIQ